MSESTRQQLEENAKTLMAEALCRATTFMQHFIGMPDHVAVIAKCELAITVVRRLDGEAAKTLKYP